MGQDTSLVVTEGALVPEAPIAVVADEPYVVSCDISTLLRRWSLQKRFCVPEQGYFREMRAALARELEAIFPSVEIIDESDLRAPLSAIIGRLRVPVISLDQAYAPFGHSLQVSRSVREDMTSAGLTGREGAGSIEEQVRTIAQSVQGDVALVDDVIFSGDMIVENIIPILRQHGISVRTVVAGVGIGSGVERVRDEVPEVLCVRIYPRVVDEICERDFYPGVPLSGRTVLGSEHIGMPYVLPFGNPVDWASIPRHAVVEFSRFCIKEKERLFSEIEHCSGRPVHCFELNRGVFGLAAGHERFVDELARARPAPA